MPDNAIAIDETCDARGLGCPMVMIELNKAINAMATGEVLEFISGETFIRQDVSSWSKRTGHELLDTVDADGVYRFLIRKGERRRDLGRKRDFSRY